MEIDAQRTIAYLKSNKVWAFAALITIFLLYSLLSSLSGGFRSSSKGIYSDSLSQNLAAAGSSSWQESSRNAADNGRGTVAGKPEVKRASLEVKSPDAKKDETKITDRAKDLGGFIESVYDSDTEDYKTVTVAVKVPSAKFEDFVAYLRDTFNVKSSSIDLYRISLKQETDEIAILQTTMDAYNGLFKKAEERGTLDSQTLSFMADITGKKLDIMRQMRQYGYSLESKQEDVEYSTLTLTLTEEKPVKLVKEGTWAKFMRELRYAIESATGSLTGMLTDTIIIVAYVIKTGFILVVAAVPIRLVLKALGRIFNVTLSPEKSPKGAPPLSEVYPKQNTKKQQ